MQTGQNDLLALIILGVAAVSVNPAVAQELCTRSDRHRDQDRADDAL
jgi:hypothetical protein